MARMLSAYIEIEQPSKSTPAGEWQRLSKVLDSLRRTSLNGYKIQAVDISCGPEDSCIIHSFGYPTDGNGGKSNDYYEGHFPHGIKRWFGVHIVVSGEPKTEDVFGVYKYDKGFKACLVVCGMTVPQEDYWHDQEDTGEWVKS